MQQAHDQGFFYLEQRGNPGEAGFGTYVVIDYNGSAPDTVHDMGNIRVFDLLGVAENQLGFTTFASHFIV